MMQRQRSPNIARRGSDQGYEVEAVRRRIARRAGLAPRKTRRRHRYAARLCRSDHAACRRRLGAERRASRGAGLSRHFCQRPSDRSGSGQLLPRGPSASRHGQREPQLPLHAAHGDYVCSQRNRSAELARWHFVVGQCLRGTGKNCRLLPDQRRGSIQRDG